MTEVKKEAEKQEVVKTEKQEVKKNEVASYVGNLIKNAQESFLAANQGFELDFVYMGTWLAVNSKGQFYDKDDESINFGDSINVVLGGAEQRFMLWGREGSEQDGQLLVAESSRDAAEERLKSLLEDDPKMSYTIADIQSRQLLFLVMLDEIKSDFPTIYQLSLPQTGKIAFGKWALNVYRGAYKKDGFKQGTNLNSIVTNITTVEKRNGNKNYIGYVFKAESLFDITKA